MLKIPMPFFRALVSDVTDKGSLRMEGHKSPQSAWSRAAGRLAIWALLSAVLTACSGETPLATVERVDIERFMGDWYVIANIPTAIESDAHNAVESYRLDADGSIATTFTFNEGGFEGEERSYAPRGFVRNKASNAEWGMQFIWPFKADYRIIYLDEDYQLTVIGRNKRDYVWVMARDWTISDADYTAMVKLIADAGYNTSRQQKVPHKW